MRLDGSFDSIAGCYIITNLINNKVYVGESMNIKNRMYQHLNGELQVFHKAILKYGVDNFHVYVEYFPNYNKEDLLLLEQQLILRFDSISPNGYNICKYGFDNTGIKQSEESKLKKSISLKGHKRSKVEIEKSSKSRTGKKRTPEQIRNISESHKGILYGPCSIEKKIKISESLKNRYEKEAHPFKGKCHTAYFKEKLSKMKAGVSNIHAKRPIIQLDPNTNEIINIWESTVDAVLNMFNDKTKASSISAVLNDRRKSAFGFKWKFKD